MKILKQACDPAGDREVPERLCLPRALRREQDERHRAARVPPIDLVVSSQDAVRHHHDESDRERHAMAQPQALSAEEVVAHTTHAVDEEDRELLESERADDVGRRKGQRHEQRRQKVVLVAHDLGAERAAAEGKPRVPARLLEARDSGQRRAHRVGQAEGDDGLEAIDLGD